MRVEVRFRRPRRAVGRGALLLAVLLAAWAAPAAAQDGGRQVVGEVIDITGVMERPRGDTRLSWTLPEGFTRSPELPVGRALRDEILRPVERDEILRLLEVERLLSR